MDRNLDSVGNGYRLYILGDLNGWIRDRILEFQERMIMVVVMFCAERGTLFG